jgi:hypothetical protein
VLAARVHSTRIFGLPIMHIGGRILFQPAIFNRLVFGHFYFKWYKRCHSKANILIFNTVKTVKFVHTIWSAQDAPCNHYDDILKMLSFNSLIHQDLSHNQVPCFMYSLVTLHAIIHFTYSEQFYLIF